MNTGGQKRIIVTACGKQYTGSLRTVNHLFDLHQKICKVCHKVNIPKFDTDQALINGTNTIKGDNTKIATIY